MKLLRRTRFGNPILRLSAQRLTTSEILSDDIQALIADMRYSLVKKKYGVGLAAPQVGRSIALSVIGIKPTPTRPNSQPFELVIINPEIVATYGERRPMWEGCISFGDPYAQAFRYKKVRVKYYDEQAIACEANFEGLPAHVLQHEIDHLNGILFVDHVLDNTSFITIQEYKKRYTKQPKKIVKS